MERGAPGESAARRFEHLHDQREAEARNRLGRFAGIYLALSDDPQTTRAWASGSVGERKLGAALEEIHDGERIVALHDRRIPGSRANIDHLVVAPSGVYVIDAKRYAGRVRCLDRGGLFSVDERVYVGRRDCTRVVLGMQRQVDAVKAALAGEGASVPVIPVVCFVDAEWGFFEKPRSVRGVVIEWPASVCARIRRDGSLGQRVPDLAARLASALPVA